MEVGKWKGKKLVKIS